MQINMGEGEMVGDRGMTMEVEDVWNLCGMEMLSCMRARLGMSVCSGGVAGSVGVDGTDGVGSDGGVDSGCGDSDGAGSIGRSRLCGSGFWVK